MWPNHCECAIDTRVNTNYCIIVLLYLLLCEYSRSEAVCYKGAVCELAVEMRRDCLLLVALHSLWFHPERWWTWLGHTETCRQMHAFPSARWMSSWNRGVLPSLIPCETDCVAVTLQEKKKKQGFFTDSSDVNPSSILEGEASAIGSTHTCFERLGRWGS